MNQDTEHNPELDLHGEPLWFVVLALTVFGLIAAVSVCLGWWYGLGESLIRKLRR